MKLVFALFVTGYLCVAAVHAEQPPPRTEKKPSSAEATAGKPENVQVLTGLSLRELRVEMEMMSDALDVKCGFCHVAGNLASDENPRKVAARRMLALTKTLNETYFAADPPTEGTMLGHVTCFTCHRGAARPINSPTQLSTLTK